MKKIILLCLAIMLPVSAGAANGVLQEPRWSFEIKGGKFYPVLDDWEKYYDKKYMLEFGMALAYKVRRQLEFGMSAGGGQAEGKAGALSHGTVTGDATYRLYPVNVFVLARGIINETQWVVPYVGGGWTRIYYHESVQYQEDRNGSADGYHIRGGLQLLLDEMDRRAANHMFLDYGIYHTYLFIEAERTTAKVKSTSYDIGGTAYLMGLLFEF